MIPYVDNLLEVIGILIKLLLKFTSHGLPCAMQKDEVSLRIFTRYYNFSMSDCLRKTYIFSIGSWILSSPVL